MEEQEKESDLLLVEDLHGVVLFGGFMLDEHDAAERAGSQCLNPVEIVQTRRVLLKKKKKKKKKRRQIQKKSQ